MTKYNVYIEGAVDGSVGGLERLAAKVAAQFGADKLDLMSRLARGRFRVKSNLDRDRAERFVEVLTQLGARAIAVDQSGTPLTVQPGFIDEPGLLTLPGVPPPETSTGTLLGFPVGMATTRPSVPSGGALTLADSGVLGTNKPFATADDSEGYGDHLSLVGLEALQVAPRNIAIENRGLLSEPAVDAFLPPQPDEVALSLAVDPRVPVASAAASSSAPTRHPPASPGPDAFLPPEMNVEVAPLEIAAAAPKKFTRSNPVVAAATTAAQSVITEPFWQRLRTAFSTRAGVRFAVGLIAAVIVGFGPAHVVASLRQGSLVETQLADVRLAQQEVESVASWEALVPVRQNSLRAIEAAEDGAAIVGIAAWLVTIALLFFLWHRKVGVVSPVA